MKFFTGMDVLSGIGQLDANISTTGKSTADFVKNLSGSYNAEVANGAIKGINLPKLLRSAQEALTTGKLPAALSPDEETDFSSMALKGDIASGTAAIQSFQLLSPYPRAEATGSIDLFNQTLDIRFRPRAVTSSNGQGGDVGVNGFGIPLRVQGSWFKIKGSLDMDYLGDIAKQQLGQKLQDEVSNRLGSELGGLLGNALGNPPRATPTPGPTATPEAGTTPAPAEVAPEETKTEEEAKPVKKEEAAISILKGILSDKKN